MHASDKLGIGISLFNFASSSLKSYKQDGRPLFFVEEILSGANVVGCSNCVPFCHLLHLSGDWTLESSITILEFVNNAITFTNEGTVSITATTSNKGGSRVDVTVSVKDSGTGVDPEILPQLFAKFASKSNEGTGLGLFICRNIVEAHGGKIWAKNNADGIGATLTFTLPVRNVLSLVDEVQEYIQEKKVGLN